MRILQIGKFYPPHMGGIETHLQTLCREVGRYAEVKVVVANDDRRPSRCNVDGVALARMGTLFNLGSAPVCPGMVREIRCSAAEVVHLHMPNPTGALAYLSSCHPGRLLVTWHSDILRQRVLKRVFNPAERTILRMAHAVVVTSDNYLRTSQPLAAHRSKCRVIPYGIDLECFDSAQEHRVAELRARYGPRIVLAIGRMVYYKGFEYLISAMQRVSAKLVIIGDGPLRPALEQKAAALGVANRIEFVGELQNASTPPYYQAADIFVLPSVARTEAFGIVQVEAMAAGKPVINTQLDSGVPAVSLHGLTGLTVSPNNPQELGDAINKLLDDSRLRELYGQSGKRLAQQKFSAGMMARAMLDLYDEIMRKTDAAPAVGRATSPGRPRPLSALWRTDC